MELFQKSGSNESEPLAHKLRPQSIEEFFGQEHILGEGRLLRRAIKADQLSSLIFYGPPGTGKTTLARVIANSTKSAFITMNAVLSGVKQLRDAIKEASDYRDLYDRKTILFVDEVHRWNKAQQDALLPWVENGVVILIGATTENPYFEVNSALVSRSRVFQLKKLTNSDLKQIADNAVENKDRGYGNFNVQFQKGALEHLIDTAAGDARSLLNSIQLAVETTPAKFPPAFGEKIYITTTIAEESIQKKVVLYDKEGDYHYDTISAFIKSIRGSDPDAVLYWLAKMVRAGEDPKFIFRRMLISASEDIGLADPQALQVTNAAAAAFDRIGMPEGRFHLTQAALYLATAPKSNSTLAFFDALAVVEQDYEVPNHLRDDNRDKKQFDHGEGYLYPHAYKNHWTAQQYLPSEMQGKIFYTPGTEGYEGSIRDDIIRKREIQLEQALKVQSVEQLTYSPENKKKEQWLRRAEANQAEILEQIRKELFSDLKIPRHSRILDINSGSGLFVWEALRKAPEGGVWAVPFSENHGELIRHFAEQLELPERPEIIPCTLKDFPGKITEIAGNKTQFELISFRDLFKTSSDIEELLSLIYDKSAKDGTILFSQKIPDGSSRLSDFITFTNEETKNIFLKAEKELFSRFRQPDKTRILKTAEKLKINRSINKTVNLSETRIIKNEEIEKWFSLGENLTNYGTIIIELYNQQELTSIKKELNQIKNREILWTTTVLLFRGTK